MLRMHAQKRNRTFHEPWGAGSVHLAQPFQGCEDPSLPTQGSLGPSRTGQYSATLGFEAESLWRVFLNSKWGDSKISLFCRFLSIGESFFQKVQLHLGRGQFAQQG